MRGATAPRLLLELLCARMLLPAATTEEPGLLERLERLERRSAIAATPPAPGEAGDVAPSGAASGSGRGAGSPVRASGGASGAGRAEGAPSPSGVVVGSASAGVPADRVAAPPGGEAAPGQRFARP